VEEEEEEISVALMGLPLQKSLPESILLIVELDKEIKIYALRFLLILSWHEEKIVLCR
jgi:hypothetical protein